MEILLKEKVIDAYQLSVVIKRDGEVHYADISWDHYDGYQVNFYDRLGKRVPYPKWATEYEAGNLPLDHSLGYWLEAQIKEEESKCSCKK